MILIAVAFLAIATTLLTANAWLQQQRIISHQRALHALYQFNVSQIKINITHLQQVNALQGQIELQQTLSNAGFGVLQDLAQRV